MIIPYPLSSLCPAICACKFDLEVFRRRLAGKSQDAITAMGLRAWVAVSFVPKFGGRLLMRHIEKIAEMAETFIALRAAASV